MRKWTLHAARALICIIILATSDYAVMAAEQPSPDANVSDFQENFDFTEGAQPKHSNLVKMKPMNVAAMAQGTPFKGLVHVLNREENTVGGKVKPQKPHKPKNRKHVKTPEPHEQNPKKTKITKEPEEYKKNEDYISKLLKPAAGKVKKRKKLSKKKTLHRGQEKIKKKAASDQEQRKKKALIKKTKKAKVSVKKETKKATKATAHSVVQNTEISAKKKVHATKKAKVSVKKET